MQPRAADGLFGDGVVVYALQGDAHADVQGSPIEGVARAGLAAFGSQVGLRTTRFECDAIDLNGEAIADRPFVVNDLGENTCGCAGQSSACQVLSTGLSPPAPLGP